MFDEITDVDAGLSIAPFDPATADAPYLMRRLRSISERIEEINSVYESEKKRLDQWRDKMMVPLVMADTNLRDAVKQYILYRRESIPDYIVRTPSGDAYLRTNPAGVTIDDPDKVIECLRTIGRTDLIREKTTYAVDKKKLDASVIIQDGHVLDDTGTIIEGVSPRPESEQLILKLG